MEWVMISSHISELDSLFILVSQFSLFNNSRSLRSRKEATTIVTEKKKKNLSLNCSLCRIQLIANNKTAPPPPHPFKACFRTCFLSPLYIYLFFFFVLFTNSCCHLLKDGTHKVLSRGSSVLGYCSIATWIRSDSEAMLSGLI